MRRKAQKIHSAYNEEEYVSRVSMLKWGWKPILVRYTLADLRLPAVVDDHQWDQSMTFTDRVMPPL